LRLDGASKQKGAGAANAGSANAGPSGAGSGDGLHLALLSGLLSRIGQYNPEQRAYLGARQTRFVLHPASALAKKPPAWVMAFELVETTQLFARTVIQAVLTDPLFHRRGTARLSTEVTSTIQRVQLRAGTYALPLLILHGSADRMVPPDGSREFFSKVRSAGSDFKEYPGAYHGLFADTDADRVIQDLRQWIEARLGSSL